jgi:hypothetical protein
MILSITIGTDVGPEAVMLTAEPSPEELDPEMVKYDKEIPLATGP